MDKMKIRWLVKAQLNFEAELLRIAEEDENAARRLAILVKEKTEMLKQFPETGRPGRILETRELVLTGFSYILPYRVRNGTIEILRFFHTAQKPPKSW